jgi:type IV pilus assembly protein PilY1
MLRKTLTVSCLFLVVGIFSVAHADDIDIFGGGVINIPPNVLIIFDNSGSMGQTVTIVYDEYYPSGTYTGSYDDNYVYRRWWWGWQQFVYIGTDKVVDESEIACESARETLNTYGHWQGVICSDAPHNCDDDCSSKRLRTGHYLNFYETASTETNTKLYFAKQTIKDILLTTPDVNFGIMLFHNTQGGYVFAPIQSRNASEINTLCSQIDGISASTWTPLAETLAEAGLYFAREASHFNSGVDYDSAFEHAIQWRCQKNYIIAMTDGESTEDRDSILTGTYMDGKSIGDYDNDVDASDDTMHDSEYYYMKDGVQYSYGSNGSDYLDDVAKFLYDEDLLDGSVYDSGGISFNYSDFPRQNIITYTIGFDIDHPLLNDTSDSEHGQGDYFTTNDNIPLSEIFETIIASILESNAQFVAPVVPVSRMNRTYAGNGVYFGIFSPDSLNPGLWKGNIKKFGLASSGVILDRDGNTATNEDGSIKDGAHSVWMNVAGTEGMTVDIGGAGNVLKTQSSRTFKTYKPGTGNMYFNTTNVTPSDLDLTTTDERDDLINYVTAQGIYAPDYSGIDGNPRDWVLGDILHSRPAVLYDYENNKNVIFVGANDGFLHCFIDDDNGTNYILTDDSVSESWAYIPWDVLPNLKYLPPQGATLHIPGDADHNYYVDGNPVIYRSGGNRYLAFGLKRGGINISTGSEMANQYFILNIDTYTSPSYVAAIATNILGIEQLGLSWGEPRFARIKQTGGNTEADVLLMTGGYDTNQDNTDPGAADTKGRAVFAVNATSGSLANTNLNDFNYNNYSKMKYCIVSFSSYDDDDDGCDDVIYAPSVGGDLFVFESKKEEGGTYDGLWSKRLLFQTQPDGGTTDKLRKFFYSPGVAQELWGDYVYIGSGDREDPERMTVTNRFYCIKNTWPETWNDNDPIKNSDLSDETSDLLQGTYSSPSAMTDEEKEDYRKTLWQGQGWFFDLFDPGEKVMSSPIVVDKVVYFTTFVPTTGISSGTDLCGVGGGSGLSYLWAVDYDTGEAHYEWFDGREDKLTVEDRRMLVKSMAEPTVVVTEKGTFIMAGPELIPTDSTKLIYRHYWIMAQ